MLNVIEEMRDDIPFAQSLTHILKAPAEIQQKIQDWIRKKKIVWQPLHSDKKTSHSCLYIHLNELEQRISSPSYFSPKKKTFNINPNFSIATGIWFLQRLQSLSLSPPASQQPFQAQVKRFIYIHDNLLSWKIDCSTWWHEWICYLQSKIQQLILVQTMYLIGWQEEKWLAIKEMHLKEPSVSVHFRCLTCSNPGQGERACLSRLQDWKSKFLVEKARVPCQRTCASIYSVVSECLERHVDPTLQHQVRRLYYQHQDQEREEGKEERSSLELVQQLERGINFLRSHPQRVAETKETRLYVPLLVSQSRNKTPARGKAMPLPLPLPISSVPLTKSLPLTTSLTSPSLVSSSSTSSSSSSSTSSSSSSLTSSSLTSLTSSTTTVLTTSTKSKTSSTSTLKRKIKQEHSERKRICNLTQRKKLATVKKKRKREEEEKEKTGQNRKRKRGKDNDVIIKEDNDKQSAGEPKDRKDRKDSLSFHTCLSIFEAHLDSTSLKEGSKSSYRSLIPTLWNRAQQEKKKKNRPIIDTLISDKFVNALRQEPSYKQSHGKLSSTAVHLQRALIKHQASKH